MAQVILRPIVEMLLIGVACYAQHRAQPSWSSDANVGEIPRRLINGGNIVNQASVTAEYPWFVSFVIFGTDDGKKHCFSSCGGAMVAPGTILTAAHCLIVKDLDISKMVAVVGFAGPLDTVEVPYPENCDRTYLESYVAARAPGAIVASIDKFVKPIHYNKVYGYDIMLVFLAASACAQNMFTVKMSGACSGLETPNGDPLTLLGFGATIGEQGVASPNMKRLDEDVQSFGTNDHLCNLNVAADKRVNSVACSLEKAASPECGTPLSPTPSAAGCAPGAAGAGGDSGGPWVAATSGGGPHVHVLVQSAGIVNSQGETHGYLIRDAWFQDWILSGVQAHDQCGGKSLGAADLFVGYAASKDQYCEGAACASCMDGIVGDTDCLMKVWCAVAPTTEGCETLPRETPLEATNCSGVTGAAGSGKAMCTTYTCPSSYKYRQGYEEQACQQSTCSLLDRDFCCRKTGWPWWAWLLLALAICYCCVLCCCPAAAAPLIKMSSGSSAASSSSSDGDDFY